MMMMMGFVSISIFFPRGGEREPSTAENSLASVVGLLPGGIGK